MKWSACWPTPPISADRLRAKSKLVEERPIVAGTIGMAFGASLEATWPRTQTEDRWLGQERDRLPEQARQPVRVERVRTSRLAQDATENFAIEAQGVVTRLPAKRSVPGFWSLQNRTDSLDVGRSDRSSDRLPSRLSWPPVISVSEMKSPLLPRNQPGARRVDGQRVISGIIHVLRVGCRSLFAGNEQVKDLLYHSLMRDGQDAGRTAATSRGHHAPV